MKHLEKKCLSCRSFRPKTSQNGICRFDKTAAPDYPVKMLEDICDHWKTSGQQYYIRAGWVRKQAEIEVEKGKA